MTAIASRAPAPAGSGEDLGVREAVAADNKALIELTAACTMHGDVALRMDRSPDFFALNRLEGNRSRIGVIPDAEGDVVGCVAAARRLAYVNDVVRPITYVGDLKVHPRARRSGAADRLTRYAGEAAADLCGPDAPLVCTILGGNSAMENRTRGPRGSAVLSRFATLSVWAIPLLWERRERVSGIHVRQATDGDLDAMAAAWRRYAPTRQFADAGMGDADHLAAWIRRAPGLTVPNYLLATDAAGRVRGFLGVWDQAAFKQMRVVGYSRRLAIVRRAINVVAPLVGSVPLPAAGSVLPALATVHVCARETHVLRALVLEAYRRYCGRNYAFITIGLDARDPMCAAVRGLLAQPTAVGAYVTTARGSADPDMFSGRLLHHETALV